MKYARLDEDLIISLYNEDEDLARNYREYVAKREKLRLSEIVNSQRLAAVCKEPYDAQTRGIISELSKKIEEENKESFREVVSSYQAVQSEVRKNFLVGNPLHSDLPPITVPPFMLVQKP